MKQIIIIALLVIIAFTYNGHYPRSKTSCQDQHVQGLFWDGQKCEVCANQYCYCSDYLGCSKCVDGYSMYTIEGLPDTRAKCYDCNAKNGTLKYAGKIKECCFHGVTNQFDYDKSLYDQKINFFPFKQDSEENNYLIPRAISCEVFGTIDQQPWQNTLEQELQQGLQTRGIGQSRRYGAYCLNYTGCVAYNNYGQCFECAEGYYLNHHNGQNVCEKCPSNCKKCGANGQCSECLPHYFLKTQKTRISIEDNAKVNNYASHCEECDENCLCDGKIVNSENSVDEELKCNLGCINNYFLLTKGVDGAQDNCKSKCPDECKECAFSVGEEETNTIVCKTCHTDFPINGSFYAPINSKKECLKCPSNCHACRLMPDGDSTTCILDKCNNGYYPVTSNQKTTCKSCSTIEGKGNVLRCDSAKLITQCEQSTQSSSTQEITYNLVHNSFVHLYHKVGEGENAICIQNQSNCKKIKPNANQGNDNVDCETCYTDNGYYISTSQNKVTCYNNQSKECRTFSATGQCVECFSGRQSVLTNQKFSKQQNYRLQDGTCKECIDNCLTCDKDKCISCQFGFYFSDSLCVQCQIDFCDECTVDSCKSCAPGYTLWIKKDVSPSISDYQCVKCSQNCLDCKIEGKSSDRRTCIECAFGYYLYQGTCYQKKINCARQKDNGDCEFCEYGYRVVGGNCFPAIDIPAGYINVEYGCGTNHRVREDGNLLNREEFSDVYQPLSSSIVQFGAVILALLALLL